MKKQKKQTLLPKKVQKKDHPFFYATQWHPEMMAVRGNDEMKKIFDKFIEACE